jgi:uncharacterized protein YndB with AHSA1/START domain
MSGAPAKARVAGGNVAVAEVVVEATPEEVWDVITSPEPRPEVMFGAETVTNWQVGGPISWRGEWQGKPFEDHGEVLEFEPARRLVVTHYSPMTGQPDIPENYHTVTYTITPHERGARVTLEQDNNETPEAAENSAKNWVQALEGVRTVAERD